MSAAKNFENYLPNNISKFNIWHHFKVGKRMKYLMLLEKEANYLGKVSLCLTRGKRLSKRNFLLSVRCSLHHSLNGSWVVNIQSITCPHSTSVSTDGSNPTSCLNDCHMITCTIVAHQIGYFLIFLNFQFWVSTRNGLMRNLTSVTVGALPLFPRVLTTSCSVTSAKVSSFHTGYHGNNR